MLGNKAGDIEGNDSSKDGSPGRINRRPSICSTGAGSSVVECDCHSEVSSSQMFAEPSQTLIFLDWDDTICPTTFLMSQPEFATKNVHESSDDMSRLLQYYQQILEEFLSASCALSDRCAIITNSRRPWVDTCVEKFFPALKEFMLEQQELGRLKIIYAGEVYMEQSKKHAAKSRPVCKVMRADCDNHEMLTAAKFYAMQQEASSFYSRYQGQTWKNILSFGDMPYEYAALQEVTWRRVGPVHEKVRTKAIILPARPSLSEILLGTQLLKVLLQTYINHDGDIDMNMQEAENPWKELSSCLRIPDMMKIAFPAHAWGRACPPSLEEFSQAMDELAILLHDNML